MLPEASGSAVAYDCAGGSGAHRVSAQLRRGAARWPSRAPTRRALGPTRRLARSTRRRGVARARGDANVWTHGRELVAGESMDAPIAGRGDRALRLDRVRDSLLGAFLSRRGGEER